MKKFTSMLAAALLVFSVAGTNLADAAEPNTIAVGGMAEQEVAPDMAYVDLGITVRANDAETARAEEAKIAQQIRRSLLGLAITDNDLQNTGYRIPVTTCIRNIRLTATANALPVSMCLILR